MKADPDTRIENKERAADVNVRKITVGYLSMFMTSVAHKNYSNLVGLRLTGL